MRRKQTFQCDKITKGAKKKRETEIQSPDAEVTHMLSVFASRYLHVAVNNL